MQSDREAIDIALLALLNTVNYPFAAPGTRHTMVWPNVPSGNIPTFYLVFFAEEVAENQAYGAIRYVRNYRIIVTLIIDPTAAAQATIPNAILAAFDKVMQTVPQGERQTLSGIVEHAWIEGTSLVLGGTLAQQLQMEIPVKVLTAM